MTVYDDTLFRTQFPEFSDTTQYPQSLISGYWDMAAIFISSDDSPYNMLNGDALALALNQMTAHLMTMGANAASGVSPGSEQGGYETSSSIDKISVSRMTPPVKGMWQFWLAQTPYGQALLALLSVMSVGGTFAGGLPEREAFRKVGGVFW